MRNVNIFWMDICMSLIFTNGNNISFRAKDEERFEVTVDAVDSQGLYQWIAQYGNRMKIESPVECIENYKKYLQDALMQYES